MTKITDLENKKTDDYDISLPVPVPSQTLENSQSVRKIRHAGHLIDQKLKYSYPNRNEKQLSIFDKISPELKGEVEKYEIKYEGIRLTSSEDKLISALYNLLHEKSENKDSSSKNFYKGNYESTEVMRFGERDVKLVHIRMTPAELYKAYMGHGHYSGKDIKDIHKTLESLAEKRFLMTYDRIRNVREGNKIENRTDRIEMFSRLIDIIKYTKNLTKEEKLQIEEGNDQVKEIKGELIIALHPILTDQINSKYVVYPSNINRRTLIAAGGYHKNVTQPVITLRDWLLRELSSGRSECQLNSDTLLHILKLGNYAQKGRKKMIKESIEKAFKINKNLNLLLDVSETIGAENQPKYIFKINPDF